MKEKKSYKGSVNPLAKDHWQIDVGFSVFPKANGDAKTAFLAMSGSKRAQPHEKINECDH